jgi:excisionase family DNA binding protein
MQPSRQTGLFVRLPGEQARLLDRAAAVVSAHKKDLISGLLARHVDPDTPEGVAALRDIAAAGGARRVVVETQEPEIQRGFGYFTPSAPADVLDAEAAADLLAVDVDTILALAERGELPGRAIVGQWRFARQALLDWLAGSERT